MDEVDLAYPQDGDRLAIAQQSFTTGSEKLALRNQAP